MKLSKPVPPKDSDMLDHDAEMAASDLLRAAEHQSRMETESDFHDAVMKAGKKKLASLGIAKKVFGSVEELKAERNRMAKEKDED